MRLSRKKFEAWLMEKPRAKAGATCKCPLNACFDISVSKDEWRPNSSLGKYSKTPPWVRDFVIRIDKLSGVDGNFRTWGNITRAQALKILRGIK